MVLLSRPVAATTSREADIGPHWECRLRVGCALVLILFLGFNGDAISFAEQAAEHWLIGAWEEQDTGAVIRVSGVQPDGAALGTMGGSAEAQRKAEIKVDGPRVRIATAVGSVIEVARKPDGVLEGTQTQRDGAVRPLTLTRMQSCMDDPWTAGAQVYGPPKYCVGDTWTFTGDRVQKVVSVSADTVVMRGFPMLGQCPGCTFELDTHLTLRSIRQPDGMSPDVMRRLLPVGEEWRFWDFPLTVGKSWRISASAFSWNNPRRYSVDCSVQGYEDVKTQAGTFKAFKVYRKWHRHQFSGGGDDWSDVMWFAPAVKTIVKLGPTTASTAYWELASYELKEFTGSFVRNWLSEQFLRAKGLRPLTQQQLEERYARRVDARFESPRTARGTLSVMPDGSVRVRGTLEDIGTWRIKDGRFCTSYSKLRQGAESCFTLFRTGDWEFSYFQQDSPITGVFIDVD